MVASFSGKTVSSSPHSPLTMPFLQPTVSVQPRVDVSVAIPTYNGAARLPEVLDRLLSQQQTDTFTWEVLVCDNNSNDATAEVVQRYQDSWRQDTPLRYVFAAQQGAAFARQRAVEQAHGAIIAFLDDDNIPSADWLVNVYQFAQAHPDAGAFGSQIHGKFEGPLPDGFDRIACFLAIIERGSHPHQYLPETKILPPAAGLAVRRRVWLEAVPERLFLNNKGKSAGLASEDLEALLHIQKAGWQIWYNPDMVVTHDIPKGRLQQDYLVALFRCVGLSRYYIRLLGVKDCQRPLMVPAYVANDLRKLALYYLRQRQHQPSWLDVCEEEHLLSTLRSPLFLLKKAGQDLGRSMIDRIRYPRRQSWLDRLSEAFEQDQFQIYRQRVTAISRLLDQEKVVSVEVSVSQPPLADHYELLLRLSDADQLVISPGQFLPVAERYGLMATIDRWMIRQYLQSPPSLQLHSVNLSATSICDRSFAKFVARQLSQSATSPHFLGFEISEKFARRYPQQVQSLALALQSLGCQILIDDVSFVLSPEQLCDDLHANFLKISRHLMALSTQQVAVRHRTQIQINQVHDLGQRAVAKGIDREQMLPPLRQIGVDYVQGYQFHAPIPMSSRPD